MNEAGGRLRVWSSLELWMTFTPPLGRGLKASGASEGPPSARVPTMSVVPRFQSTRMDIRSTTDKDGDDEALLRECLQGAAHKHRDGMCRPRMAGTQAGCGPNRRHDVAPCRCAARRPTRNVCPRPDAMGASSIVAASAAWASWTCAVLFPACWCGVVSRLHLSCRALRRAGDAVRAAVAWDELPFPMAPARRGSAFSGRTLSARRRALLACALPPHSGPLAGSPFLLVAFGPLTIAWR